MDCRDIDLIANYNNIKYKGVKLSLCIEEIMDNF